MRRITFRLKIGLLREGTSHLFLVFIYKFNKFCAELFSDFLQFAGFFSFSLPLESCSHLWSVFHPSFFLSFFLSKDKHLLNFLLPNVAWLRKSKLFKFFFQKSFPSFQNKPFWPISKGIKVLRTQVNVSKENGIINF
jgi:hypothetical protein